VIFYYPFLAVQKTTFTFKIYEPNMAASEESYERAQGTEKDALQIKEEVQNSGLNASSDAIVPSQICTPVEVKKAPKKKKAGKKKKNRCDMPGCNAKIKAKLRKAMACRCGLTFCNDHRLQCDHDCKFEKSQAPQVKSAKFDVLGDRI